MQKYKEINGNDYVKDSRTTINETMQSIQSMNSGTAFPTNNLFEGMKCYRTDLKKTYTLTDAENGTWVEDAHASLSDEATHAASATRLQTPRALNLSGAVTADAANFDGTADATINVKTLDASKLKGTTSVSTTGNAATATKLAAARTIALSGNASGSTTFDGSGNATINATVNESAHAATATKVVTTAADGASANIAEATMASNDLARIRVSGTTNAGELALETAYDGSEPIVARQYTGIYTTPIRTAKILDESGNTSFPGTVVAPKFTGSLNGNAATASKLSTARKINITGNATGAATFDGTSDANINVSVSQAAHADKATQDTNGRAFTDTNAYMHISALADNTDFNNVKTTGIYYCTGDTYPNRPYGSWGILTVYSIGTVKQEYRPDNAAGYYTREYNNANWTAWSKVNAANADTATKLATPRAISLTGNASGSATFDGSGNVSINTTVNESKHAAAANNDGDGANIANTYLKRSGGTMTGPLNFANLTWNLVGDDSYMGDYNISGTFCVKGANGETGIALFNEENEGDYARISYGGGNINFNKKIGGNLAGTADNADTVDGIHAASMFYNKGDWGADNWGTIGAYQVNNNPPVSDAYGWGQVISISTADARFQLYASDQNNNGRLRYRTGWDNNKDHPWNTILDSENYNLFAPTKTGGGASGTWGINISGNADNATKWNGLIDDYTTENNTDTWIPVYSDGKMQHTDRTKMTVGNADTVDGYHASDLLDKITASNTGIVAASLTENGYVKFANGLILQWGYGNGGSKVTFPISFSSFARVVVTCSNSNWAWTQGITITGFNLRADGGGCWLAVGM